VIGNGKGSWLKVVSLCWVRGEKKRTHVVGKKNDRTREFNSWGIAYLPSELEGSKEERDKKANANRSSYRQKGGGKSARRGETLFITFLITRMVGY